MNRNQRPTRTLAAVGATVALTLAACGGDDDAEPADEPATEEPAADETAVEAPAADIAMSPSSITFDAQESDGSTITIASVELPADGFVAVHGDGGGSPGPVIGVSDLLPAGTATDVMITLLEPLTADATLYPMVHIDTDGNGRYEFGTVEGADGPGTTADGAVAVVGGEITVVTGDESSAPVEGDTITIANFAFDGVSEIAVGTTVVVTNTDTSPHTWTAADGLFDSGALAPGDTFEFTFTEPGEFAYSCNFHPSMQGTITVTN